MPHEPKIVEVKQLSDGALAFRARCCDDPMSDSWHTVSATVARPDVGAQGLVPLLPASIAVNARTEEEFAAEEAEHLKATELKHEAMLRAKAYFEKRAAV